MALNNGMKGHSQSFILVWCFHRGEGSKLRNSELMVLKQAQDKMSSRIRFSRLKAASDQVSLWLKSRLATS
jgi:hypothetical protein